MVKFYKIQLSPGKGIGVFANQHIPKGTRILSEDAFFSLELPTAIDIYKAFLKLPPAVRHAYLSLTHCGDMPVREGPDQHQPTRLASKRPPPPKTKLEQYAQAITEYNLGPDTLPNVNLDEAAKVVAIFHNNGFEMRNNTDTRHKPSEFSHKRPWPTTPSIRTPRIPGIRTCASERFNRRGVS